MSRIDDLIRELCPKGVERYPLSEVATYVRGVTYKKSDESEFGPIKVLRSNNISVNSNTLNFKDVKTVGPDVRVRANQRLRKNDILMSAASGSRAHVGKVAFIDSDMDFCFGGFMAVIRTQPTLVPRFLFHLLAGKAFSDFLEVSLSTSTINNLSASLVGGFPVPTPPLHVQEEIVRILDTFTELETELEAELEARTAQYKETRNRLMDFDVVENHPFADLVRELCPEGVQQRRLADVISHIRTGLNPRSNFRLNQDGAVGWYVTVRELDGFDIRYKDKTDRLDGEGLRRIQQRSQLSAGDVLFSGTGTIGRTALVTAEPLDWNIKEGVYALTPDSSQINSRFLIYLLNSGEVAARIESKSAGSTVKSIPFSALKGIELPVPPLPVQEEIVRILDSFDALVSDLSVGLPAEIFARRKQYEYYRDKLLSFEELAA